MKSCPALYEDIIEIFSGNNIGSQQLYLLFVVCEFTLGIMHALERLFQTIVFFLHVLQLIIFTIYDLLLLLYLII